MACLKSDGQNKKFHYIQVSCFLNWSCQNLTIVFLLLSCKVGGRMHTFRCWRSKVVAIRPVQQTSKPKAATWSGYPGYILIDHQRMTWNMGGCKAGFLQWKVATCRVWKERVQPCLLHASAWSEMELPIRLFVYVISKGDPYKLIISAALRAVLYICYLVICMVFLFEGSSILQRLC